MARVNLIRTRKIDFSEVVTPLSTIERDIEDILSPYVFEINTKETREQMCYVISRYLNLTVIDKSTNYIINKGSYFFLVQIDGEEIPLKTFIDNIISIERRKKILKLKNKLRYELHETK